MVLLIGIGFRPLPNEDAVIEKLSSSIPKEGFYFFPGKELRGNPTPEQEAEWEAKYRRGPTGILIYRSTGGTPVSPRKLLISPAVESRPEYAATYLRIVGHRIAELSSGYHKPACRTSAGSDFCFCRGTTIGRPLRCIRERDDGPAT
jgi:hypothetical protein